VRGTNAAESVANDGEPSRPLVITLCFLVAILEGYDLQAMGVAAPQLAPALGLSSEALGIAFSATTFGLALGAIFGGWVSDRIGRKPVLVTSVVAFGVFTLATAFVVDFQTLFMVRLAAGIGFGAAMPNLIAIASEVSSRGKITTSVAVLFGGLPMGGMSVALLSQYVPAGDGWRILFYVGGVLPVIVAPVLMWGLPETRRLPAAAAREPASGAAESAPPPAGGVLRALFGPGQVAITVSLWLAFILTLLQLYVLLNWLPSLVVARGMEDATASTAALMLNVGSIAGAFLVGRMCDAYGPRWPMVGVYALMALSMWALTQVSSFAGIVVVSAAAGFSVVGAQFALYGLAPHFYPPAIRGAGVGAAVAAGRIGSIIGPTVVGLLLGLGFAAEQVILSTIPNIVIGGVALVSLTYVGAAFLRREPGGAAA
jgi:MFS transporter, AAHS family, 3-hydroxyphenylpropionic acid transporter